jgi:hypothetical protein
MSREESSRLYREMVARNPNTGAHGSHCWMNGYFGCKYGDEDCPATQQFGRIDHSTNKASSSISMKMVAMSTKLTSLTLRGGNRRIDHD